MTRQTTLAVHGASGLLAAALTQLATDVGWRHVDLGRDDESVPGVIDADAVIAHVSHATSMRRAAAVCSAARGAVVALIAIEGPEAFAEALRIGCIAAVPVTIEPAPLVRIIELAIVGYSVTPVHAARWLSMHAESAAIVTDEELAWLGELDRGQTVTELAAKVGYSERSLYRLLSALYGRLGVSNRHQAIAEARSRGLL